MGLDTYIAAYRGEYPFVPERTIAQGGCGVSCSMEVLRFRAGMARSRSRLF